MKVNGEIFYNFPVPIMRGFEDKNKARDCLNNVLYYCAYRAWNNRDTSKVKPDKFYEYICGSLGLSFFPYRNARSFSDNYKNPYYDYKGAFFSISKKLFFLFYDNLDEHNKEEHEEYYTQTRITFLAYLAIKSIIGGKREYALTNRFFLTSRMAGNNSLVDDLPPEILKYRKRYHFEKLRDLLIERFFVAFYADTSTRGFYVSLKKTMSVSGKISPDFKWLMEQVIQQRDKKKQSAFRLAMERLKSQQQRDNNTTTTRQQRNNTLKGL